MKFKDNIFFKAYELKVESDFFKPIEDQRDDYNCLTTTYDFKTGINVMMEYLFEHVSYFDLFDVTISDKKRYLPVDVGDAGKALFYLKDKDVVDIEDISTTLRGINQIEYKLFELNFEDDVVLEKVRWEEFGEE